ncbi:MAG TPA: hypothetical protein VMT47_05270 [Polyangia bacterium]|nr:hypothetical protein [Polyangia bacterium]
MKIHKGTLTLSSVVVVAVAGLATPAFAQDTTPPATTTEAAPVKRAGRTSGDVGSGGLGVGATVFVSGLAGPEVVYDFGLWHLGGMIGFFSSPQGPTGNRASLLDFGVSGWYHLHLGENSDFSLGGAFGLETYSPPVGNGTTGFEFEPGAQIRAFITPNVALHGGMAIVLAFGDQVANGFLEKQIALGARITGDFGFTYYFR